MRTARYRAAVGIMGLTTFGLLAVDLALDETMSLVTVALVLDLTTVVLPLIQPWSDTGLAIDYAVGLATVV